MPRKTLIRSSHFPYHITAHGNNREEFPSDLRLIWSILSQNLQKISEELGVQVHAFVLMPNHFHLILTTTKEDLGIVMREFMRSTTKTINQAVGRSGRIFGSRYHWSMIEQIEYFDYAMKYVFRNPVKAKLCANVQDYPFSTLNEITYANRFQFPIYPLAGNSSLVPSGLVEEYLEWLNKPFSSELDQSIQAGLRKTYFRGPKTKWTRSKLELAHPKNLT